jgi:tetratricopeptide (TPR) repeat protein
MAEDPTLTFPLRGEAHAAPPWDPNAVLGRTLQGRYRIDEPIGSGAMGVVFRGRDLELERDVAVKLLAPARALDPVGRDRLLREARAAAALNHPHIVTIFDIGEENGAPFLVMEIVRGTSLRGLGTPATPLVLEVGRQICAALEHAHDHGIVHRDLKPDNVLVARSAGGLALKVTDLGVARLRTATRLTADGHLVGTAAYMSPEQALGRDVDARSDLYSLGIVLYELVTGRLPFVGDNVLEVVSQHVHAPVVPPRAYRPDVSHALESVILRLLSKDPASRFASAREVAERLSVIAADPTATEDTASVVAVLDDLVRGRLVGRAEQLRELRDLWYRTLEGHAHLVVISGEPGAGKTRLAREMLVRAEVEGAVVLSGGCYEYEAATPYLPFVEAIRGWVKQASDEALAVTAGPYAAELVRLAPEIADRLPALPDLPRLSPQEERSRLFDCVARFFSALAARNGLLLFLDDLQWADQGTIALLRYVLRQLRDERVLVLAAYREMELGRDHPLGAALVDWNRERLATRIQVGRLPLDGTSAMLGALLSQEQVTTEFAAAVHRETEGNPFFIEELVKALIEQGQIYRAERGWRRVEVAALAIPQSVREAIGRRLDRLGASSVEVLHVAAALGKTFDFDELQAAVEAGEDALSDALDEARAAQLLAARGAEGFSFTHDKIREVLYEELNPVRRRRLHRRIAEGLIRLRGEIGPCRAERLAHHYLESGDLENGMRWAILAAEHAERVFAHPEALAYYRRALECADELEQRPAQARIEEAIGAVHDTSGDWRAAGEHFERAIALTEDPVEVLRLKCRAGVCYVRTGHPRGHELVREALEGLDAHKNPLELATAYMVLGRYHHLRGEHRRALEYLEHARVRAESAGDPRVVGDVYAFFAGAYQHLTDYPAGNLWAEKTIELGQRVGDEFISAQGHEFLAEHANCQGRWRLSLEHSAIDQRTGEKLHARDRIVWARFSRGWSLRGLGRLEESEAEFKATIELAEQMDETRVEMLARAELSNVLVDRGELEAARSLSALVLERADALGLLWGRLEARRALAVLAAAEGKWDTVLARIEECRALYEHTDSRGNALFAGALHALALLRTGRVDAAALRVEAYLAQAFESDSPHHTGVGHRVRAEIRLAQGDTAGAQADLNEAIATLTSTESRVELARARAVGSGLER